MQEHLTRLEEILERASRHLEAMRSALAARGAPRRPPRDARPTATSRTAERPDVPPLLREGPSSGSRPDASSGWEETPCPDTSGAASTAEAIQRCLAVLVRDRGTAVLADTKGFLLAGVGSAEQQEGLAAVAALAAQMAARTAEFLEDVQPQTLLLAAKGDHFLGATFFPTEDANLVLVLSGPGELHRAARIRQVFEWIRPLLASGTWHGQGTMETSP